MDLLLAELDREDYRYQAQWHALDNKAGTILAFAAGSALAASVADSLLFIPAKIAASAATFLALWAAVPRKVPLMNLGNLARKYLQKDSSETKEAICAARLKHLEETDQLIDTSARRLRLAFRALFIAAATLLVAVFGELLA